MVFQQFNLFHLSILDNCTLAPIWVKKTPKKSLRACNETVEQVQIADQANEISWSIIWRSTTKSSSC